MRKLSLLIALCTLLTIGGVYATWTYSDGAIQDGTGEKAMQLSGLGSATPHGTYAVKTSGLALMIDPASQTNPARPKDVHVTTLRGEGSVVLTFTPNINASDDIKTHGPDSVFAIRINGPADWTYDDHSDKGSRDVLVLKPTDHDHTITWVSDGNGAFTFEIPASVILEHLELTEFTLDTINDYNEFTEILKQATIEFVVSDAPAAE